MTGRAFEWMFRNRRTGRITVAQVPNVALWLFLATVIAGRIVDGAAKSTVAWIGVVSLGWWALDEVVRGVNPWRRLLGLAVGALVAARAVSLGGS